MGISNGRRWVCSLTAGGQFYVSLDKGQVELNAGGREN